MFLGRLPQLKWLGLLALEMKTNFEIFDRMLEEVQQLRLDANYFSKSTSRIDAKVAVLRRRCKKYEERLMRGPSEKYTERIFRCHSMIKKLLSKRHTDFDVFRSVVHGLKQKCESLCDGTDAPFCFKEPSISNMNCLVNAGDGGGDTLYCKCNRPAFGNMIACDSSECKVGWFHCECVGFGGSSKMTWICMECKKRTTLQK